ncbi:LysR family transcriptional regulator [Pendulispora albinea]|uniref:LysR family transcriptional regulator n=1 Tax=Pendulispora albinea TaxID=2741071 RepID=A0ABZ2M3X6_9BACT
MTILQEPLTGLAAFVHAVETGSFSAAGRLLGASPSAVSKVVAKLESRLGVRLLQRTTRALHPTAEGLWLYERGQRIVTELAETEVALREAHGPRGLLRITAPVDLGRHWLTKQLPKFFAQYPEITCELSLTDRFVDLVDDRFDVALRMGEAADGPLIRRKLGPTRTSICAAPRYLRRRGTPRHPKDLAAHDCLPYARDGKRQTWTVGNVTVSVTGPFAADNCDALLAMALSGAGVVLLPRIVAAPDVGAGRLRALFPKYPSYGPNVYAVYPEQRHLSPRVRAFVDFLATEYPRSLDVL